MSYQNTIIIGYVGGKATTRMTATGRQVANFSIAVNEKFGDETLTTWFHVVAWENLADIAEAHITKGQLLLVEGRIATEMWTDKQGAVNIALKLTASRIRFLCGKPE